MESQCYSQPFGPIQRGSWDSMLPHVGLCWGYVGLRWPRAGSKMAQDRFMLAQVGPKLPKKVPQGPKMRLKWFQDELQIENFEVFGRKARKCVWSYYSNVFLLFGSWESINFDQFWEPNPMKFPSFWPSWVVYAPRSLTISARWST